MCTKILICLCFRVLSNQYVERSAYANVASLTERINVLREPIKVNSRCFHWFQAAMLGVSILNTIIFSDTFCGLTGVQDIAHPRNFGTLFIYYPSTIFQLLDSIY